MLTQYLLPFLPRLRAVAAVGFSFHTTCHLASGPMSTFPPLPSSKLQNGRGRAPAPPISESSYHVWQDYNLLISHFGLQEGGPGECVHTVGGGAGGWYNATLQDSDLSVGGACHTRPMEKRAVN